MARAFLRPGGPMRGTAVLMALLAFPSLLVSCACVSLGGIWINDNAIFAILLVIGIAMLSGWVVLFCVCTRKGCLYRRVRIEMADMALEQILNVERFAARLEREPFPEVSEAQMAALKECARTAGSHDEALVILRDKLVDMGMCFTGDGLGSLALTGYRGTVPWGYLNITAGARAAQPHAAAPGTDPPPPPPYTVNAAMERIEGSTSESAAPPNGEIAAYAPRYGDLIHDLPPSYDEIVAMKVKGQPVGGAELENGTRQEWRTDQAPSPPPSAPPACHGNESYVTDEVTDNVTDDDQSGPPHENAFT